MEYERKNIYWKGDFPEGMPDISSHEGWYPLLKFSKTIWPKSEAISRMRVALIWADVRRPSDPSQNIWKQEEKEMEVELSRILGALLRLAPKESELLMKMGKATEGMGVERWQELIDDLEKFIANKRSMGRSVYIEEGEEKAFIEKYAFMGEAGSTVKSKGPKRI